MDELAYYAAIGCCLLIQATFWWLMRHDRAREQLTKSQLAERSLGVVLVAREAHNEQRPGGGLVGELVRALEQAGFQVVAVLVCDGPTREHEHNHKQEDEQQHERERQQKVQHEDQRGAAQMQEQAEVTRCEPEIHRLEPGADVRALAQAIETGERLTRGSLHAYVDLVGLEPATMESSEAAGAAGARQFAATLAAGRLLLAAEGLIARHGARLLLLRQQPEEHANAPATQDWDLRERANSCELLAARIFRQSLLRHLRKQQPTALVELRPARTGRGTRALRRLANFWLAAGAPPAAPEGRPDSGASEAHVERAIVGAIRDELLLTRARTATKSIVC